MTVNETRHAYIDLTIEEVNELCNILNFLKELDKTVNTLEEEDTVWDIRSDSGEDGNEIFNIIDEIRHFANRLT